MNISLLNLAKQVSQEPKSHLDHPTDRDASKEWYQVRPLSRHNLQSIVQPSRRRRVDKSAIRVLRHGIASIETCERQGGSNEGFGDVLSGGTSWQAKCEQASLNIVEQIE